MGNEQLKCPYWHRPIACHSIAWLSGTRWKIKCKNREEGEYWSLLLSSFGAKVLYDDSTTGNVKTVGSEETIEENCYFNSVELYRKISSEVQHVNTKSLQRVCLDLEDSELVRKHEKNVDRSWPLAPSMGAREGALLKFQDLFRRHLKSLGILQLPIKLWITKELEEICWDSVTTDFSGCFQFGVKNFLIGYQISASSDSAKHHMRAMCSKF